jgi:hypothetical protein
MQRATGIESGLPRQARLLVAIDRSRPIGWLVDHLRRAARDQTTPHKTFVPDCPTQSQRMSATVRHGPDFFSAHQNVPAKEDRPAAAIAPILLPRHDERSMDITAPPPYCAANMYDIVSL